MSSLPAGYKLVNGFFEKTITFVQKSSYGVINTTTETIVRDARGRLIGVYRCPRFAVHATEFNQHAEQQRRGSATVITKTW